MDLCRMVNANNTLVSLSTALAALINESGPIIRALIAQTALAPPANPLTNIIWANVQLLEFIQRAQTEMIWNR